MARQACSQGGRGKTLTAEIEPKLFLRPGFAISCIGHMAMLTIGLMFAGANPFESAPAEAITVELVSPNEVETGFAEPEPAPAVAEKAPSFELPALTTTPSTQQPQPTPSTQQPQPTPSTQQPQPTSTQQPQPTPSSPSTPRGPTLDPRTTRQALAPTQASPSPSSMPWFQPLPDPAPPTETHELNPADMFAMPLALPDGKLGGSFDAAAIDKASIPNDDIAAFHDHLKSCSKLPAGVNVTDNVKAVVRVFLKPDGTLAEPPTAIRVDGVSRGGGDLYQSIVTALRQCQPYNMLPRDKYDEWKVFDLTFTPQSFAGG
jgi:outer membrane biosynthesis protein TonB